MAQKPDEPKAEIASLQPFDGDWGALIERAGLRGPVGQLARHSSLIGIDGALVTLALKAGHDDLAAPTLLAVMQEKLSAALGKTVKVRYEKTAAPTETPADSSARETAARQRAAEQALGSDSFVQALIRDFDARVIPESIRPAAQTKSMEK